MADDLGYNDLSFYRKLTQDSTNHLSTRTPNIDLLAQRGISFTDFYSGSPVCSPSRAALLTGRFASRTGVYNWIPENSPMHLRDEEVTLAEVLLQNGYETGHFGKWHLSSEGMEQPGPLDQGFNYAFWTYNNAMPSHLNPVNFIRNRENVGGLDGFSCHLVVDEAIQWLNANIKTKKNDPFYLNVWFHEPHEKVAAPDSLVRRHYKNAVYQGAIENMDLAVGRLYEWLLKHQLIENTIIIFTSDNGSIHQASNFPWKGRKGLLYEGGVKVPMIFSWPNNIPVGEISGTVGHFVDILPTLTALTQANLPESKIDGKNLSSEIFEVQGKNRNDDIFFYRYFTDPICLLREDQFILLGFRNAVSEPDVFDGNMRARSIPKPSPNELRHFWDFQPSHMDSISVIKPRYFKLYDLSNDPMQLTDLKELYPEIYERLKIKMENKRLEVLEEGGNWYLE